MKTKRVSGIIMCHPTLPEEVLRNLYDALQVSVHGAVQEIRTIYPDKGFLDIVQDAELILIKRLDGIIDSVKHDVLMALAEQYRDEVLSKPTESNSPDQISPRK